MNFITDIKPINAFRVSLDHEKFPGFFVHVAYPSFNPEPTTAFLGHETQPNLLYLNAIDSIQLYRVLQMIEESLEDAIMEYVVLMHSTGNLPENLKSLYEQAVERTGSRCCCDSCYSKTGCETCPDRAHPFILDEEE